MAMMETFDNIEADAFKIKEIDVKEQMQKLNAYYKTALTPENGMYGSIENVKDNGTIERTWKNEFNHTVRQYFSEGGKLLKQRVVLGRGNIQTSCFDDNGTEYLTKVSKIDDHYVKNISIELTPNTTVVKDNFTAVTDSYGRPVLNKITDLQIKQGSKDKLDSIVKTKAYRDGDDKGHLIADKFGGPTSEENIVPQCEWINESSFKRVEAIVKSLKEEGHTVDYEVKTNYVGTSKRPSSFEPKITVDGSEFTELPEDLKKIYNEDPDANFSNVRKVASNIGEKTGYANEVGIKNGLVAAGLTAAVSTCENVSDYLDGEISGEEMAGNIVKDTAVSGAIGYGTGFATQEISQVMRASSNTMISKVGSSCAPAVAVSFAVESYDDVSDYAHGKIDGEELAYNLGENAAGILGSTAGGAAGGLAGSAAGPVGTFAGSVVGSTVGCAVCTEAYKTAVEAGENGAEVLGEKAQSFAQSAKQAIAKTVPDKLSEVQKAFDDYAKSMNLPFSL